MSSKLPRDPKWKLLSDRAKVTYVEWACEVAEQETDGHYSVAGKDPRCVPELIAAGLILPAKQGGYFLPAFLKNNRSHAEMSADRERARSRMRLNADPTTTAAVKTRDRGCCRYCGCLVNWADRRSPKGGTYDHVIPLSQGGSSELDNVVIACRRCNERKGARTPAEAGLMLNDLQVTSKSAESVSRQEGELEVELEVVPEQLPAPNPGAVSEDWHYLLGRLLDKGWDGLSHATLKKLERIHGRGVVDSALREAHGYSEVPPMAAYPYLASICARKAAEAS